MTTRADLRRLIDQLPEEDLTVARRYLEYLRHSSDPLLKTLLNAQLDDEPDTTQERKQAAQALAEYKAGKVTSAATLKRSLVR